MVIYIRYNVITNSTLKTSNINISKRHQFNAFVSVEKTSRMKVDPERMSLDINSKHYDDITRTLIQALGSKSFQL